MRGQATNGASPPGRMARIRPTPEMPVVAIAVTRAWTTTTSADPPSDANMRRPTRPTAERTLNPARSRSPQNQCLTSAIRELFRGQTTAMQEAAKGFRRQSPQAVAALEGRARQAKGAGNFREPASRPNGKGYVDSQSATPASGFSTSSGTSPSKTTGRVCLDHDR